ncbi:MAG: DUF3999 family protein, partial [Elusimicrobia bacterium]|nr:DUF3999 family protein [Elusimicrobiota bacterium]
ANMKAGALYRVDLNAEVLRNCAPGQPDIRLFAPDGAEVPYSLVKAEYVKKAAETYAAEITGYQADGREAVLEFSLNGRFLPVTSVELSIADRDFRKDAEVFGSADGKNWSRLGAGAIYDYSSQVDLRRTRLDFPRSAHRFYRLKLRDTEEQPARGKTVSLKYDGIDLNITGGKGLKLRIDGVTARTGGQDSVVGVYDEASFEPSAAGENRDNTSYIVINKGLPFDKVEFAVEDGFFVREFTAWYSDTGAEDSYRRLAGGNIFRFPSGWPDGERTSAEISSPGHAFYKFVFNNRNNPPLRVKSLRFKWLRRSVYFIAPAAMPSLTVAYGRPDTAPPAYDVENFVNQGNWEQRTALALRLGAPVLTPGYSPEAPADKKTKTEKDLLTGILVLVVAGMGFWLFNLLKKISPPAAPGKGDSGV